MIEKLEESSGNTLGYKVAGTITREDYEGLNRDVQALIDRVGEIGMLLDLSEFHWEKVDAWGADLKFGHDYHRQIARMAIVGHEKWQKWLSHLAAPFYARKAEFFDVAHIESAWAWARDV